MECSRRTGWLAAGLGAVLLALSSASPAMAAPAHCQGYDIYELQAMEPALRMQWFTDELALCAKPAWGWAADYIYRGNAYYELGQYQQAIADYTSAIAYDPGFSAAYSGRGLAYAALDQYQQAIADYTSAIAVAPGATDYSDRGVAYCLVTPKQIEAALSDWLTAIRLEPHQARLYQEILRDAGFYTGPIDGDFGPPSQAAFRAWCASAS